MEKTDLIYLQLLVNGKEENCWITPNTTLLEVLREKLGHWEVKSGCEKGDCGTCTILLDGKAVNACLVLAPQANGSEIVTVLGLKIADKLHPLQQSFVEHGAIQCGFCTPGIILSAKSLIDRTPHPSRQEIREAISGNLCRCTGYKRIIDAIEAVVNKQLGKVDSSTLRSDLVEKATGETRYAADFQLPGMLYGAVLRSKYPRAQVVAIDTKDALSMEGVHAVMTAKDVPCNKIVTKFGQKAKVGGFEGYIYILAEREVCYLGQAIALVAADSLAVAERAIRSVKVEYKELPGIFDPMEALKAGAPILGEGNSSIISSYNLRKGDIEEGFRQSDVIVENTYSTGFFEHACLETESGIGWVEPDGTIKMRVSTQVVEHAQEVAQILTVLPEKVRVIPAPMGGAFGGKNEMTVEPYLALLAWKTRRPIKMVCSREESILSHSKRHPFIYRYKTGAKSDGTLMALQVDMVSDAGAFILMSPWVLLVAMITAAGPYGVPNISIDGKSVLTNNTPTSAMRGFGSPQTCFACESQMEALARALGMDSLSLRKKNYVRKADTLSTGEAVKFFVAHPATAEKAIQALGERTGSQRGKRIGRGIASGMAPYGRLTFLHDQSSCAMEIDREGHLKIQCCIPDPGGGQVYVLKKIAGDVLSVSANEVFVDETDSLLGPLAGTTTATRQTYMSGNAAFRAATGLRKILLTKAARILKSQPGHLDMSEGRIFVKEDPVRSLSFQEVVQGGADDGLPARYVSQFQAPFSDVIDFGCCQGNTYPDFTFGSTAAEVEVDEITGRVKILKLVSCFDVGKAINPPGVIGQIEGGEAMGIGFSLLEDFRLDKGYTKTLSLAEYLVPTALDVPDLQAIIYESGEGLGPHGSRGIGEPALVPVAAAIANALYDALGVQLRKLPITSERVLEALNRNSKTSG